VKIAGKIKKKRKKGEIRMNIHGILENTSVQCMTAAKAMEQKQEPGQELKPGQTKQEARPERTWPPSYDQYCSEDRNHRIASDSLQEASKQELKSASQPDKQEPNSLSQPDKQEPKSLSQPEPIPSSDSANEAEGKKGPEKDNRSGKEEETKKSETCTANTDQVDREIEKLKKKKKELEQQIQSETDEKKLSSLEKRLAQIEYELQQKDNDSYRRQHTVFT